MATDPAAKVVVDVLDAQDRRRPGRRGDASPELTGLLRGTGGTTFLAPEEDDDTSPLSVARGIKSAVLLSAIFWGLAIALLFFLLI